MSTEGLSATESKALRALRRLDDRFGGYGPGEWTFDGEPLPDSAITEALLLTHDHILDIDRERAS